MAKYLSYLSSANLLNMKFIQYLFQKEIVVIICVDVLLIFFNEIYFNFEG